MDQLNRLRRGPIRRQPGGSPPLCPRRSGLSTHRPRPRSGKRFRSRWARGCPKRLVRGHSPDGPFCRHLRIGLPRLLRHLLPEHSRVLAGEGGSQGGGGGRDQAERTARQRSQGQGNGPAGERSHQLYRSPDPGRRCPCGCPRQVVQLIHRPWGPIRRQPGGSPPLCPTGSGVSTHRRRPGSGKRFRSCWG